MSLLSALTRAVGILLVAVSVATVTGCADTSTTSATTDKTTVATPAPISPASKTGTTLGSLPPSGPGPIRDRSLGTTDVPAGFRPTSGGDVDKAAAVQGSTVDGAVPLLEAGFRAGREMRWTDGSDTIYQLVIEFDDSAGASSYFDVSASDKDTGPAEGLPRSRVFEGSDDATGAHWVSILIVRGRYIAVTQYASHGDIDPAEAARTLSRLEFDLLDR